MIGIFQGSPEGRANKCQSRAKGGLPRAKFKKQGKSRAWQGTLQKAEQFGSYASLSDLFTKVTIVGTIISMLNRYISK